MAPATVSPKRLPLAAWSRNGTGQHSGVEWLRPPPDTQTADQAIAPAAEEFMLTRSGEGSFEDYRLQRKRMQARLGTTPHAAYSNDALRELELVEEREVRDQQLTREVHEFFASATRQAAGIVERVAKEAEAEVGQRIEQEMESFLIDALARMNTFVMTVLQQRRAPVAEQHLEPDVANLVGHSLDEFRWAGTAELGDKHIGQDPFATDLEEVCRELRGESAAQDEAPAPAEAPAVAIEEHLVASVAVPDPAPEPAAGAAPAAASAPGRAQAAAELERFKDKLKQLVLDGTMTREEARAAWLTRLQSLGYKPLPAAAG